MQRVSTGYGKWAFRSFRGTCRRCGEVLPLQAHQGRSRKWCSEACRLKAYRVRKASTAPQ